MSVRLGRILGVLVAVAAPLSPTAGRAREAAAAQPDPAAAPAVRYGRLDRTSCEAELGRRQIRFSRVDSARGVLAPVRITGALHGVSYRTELPAKQRPTTPYEIFDCRLVLALDDFSAMLESHGIVEVIHYSAYRPPPTKWPSGKLGTRHGGALAIDAGKFVKKDGSILVVERDFHGKIGSATCGPGTGPEPVTPEATELRELVCDAATARLFNVELTPDYNYPHRNHFHLEVTAKVNWFLVH
jgi:hypothetical protein